MTPTDELLGWRIYATASAILAASHGLAVERAIPLVQMIVDMFVEVERLRSEVREASYHG
jgi:AmiR/NasT family two-component response regulator